MSKAGKTVLITGATGDFGKAFARKFYAGGFLLVLHGRNQAKLEALKAEFPDAQLLCFDITDRDCVVEALRDLDAVDVLINNAGGALGQEPAYESNLDDWASMIDSNVQGLVAVTHTMLPKMTAAGRGHIINIGSVASHKVFPLGNIYPATKHAVKVISEQLRLDLLGTNIRVSQIDPGPVYTEFSEKRWGDKQKVADFYAKMQPLIAEDIAEAVVFCTSRKSHINIDDLIINSISTAGTYLAGNKKSIFD